MFAEPVERRLPSHGRGRVHADLLDSPRKQRADVALVVDHQHRAAGICRGELAHERRESAPVNGLGHALRGAERETEVPVVADGEHDHGDVRELRLRLHDAQHRPAVDLADHHVERDHVGRVAAHSWRHRATPPAARHRCGGNAVTDL
jgi:hypothetical protein